MQFPYPTRQKGNLFRETWKAGLRGCEVRNCPSTALPGPSPCALGCSSFLRVLLKCHFLGRPSRAACHFFLSCFLPNPSPFRALGHLSACLLPALPTRIRGRHFSLLCSLLAQGLSVVGSQDILGRGLVGHGSCQGGMSECRKESWRVRAGRWGRALRTELGGSWRRQWACRSSHCLSSPRHQSDHLSQSLWGIA